jgi:hypothetical protein
MDMTVRSLAAVTLVALPLLQPLAPPAFAQSQGGLTLAQVQQRYFNMSPVHIRKCDYDGNGLYDRSEMNCVSGIYRAMYVDR